MTVTYSGPWVAEDGSVHLSAIDTEMPGYYTISYAGVEMWIIEQRNWPDGRMMINQTNWNKGKIIFMAILYDNELPRGDIGSVWVNCSDGRRQFLNLFRYGLTAEGRPRPWWYDLNDGYPAPVEWYEELYYGAMADRIEEEQPSLWGNLTGLFGTKVKVTKKEKRANVGLLERLDEFA